MRGRLPEPSAAANATHNATTWGLYTSQRKRETVAKLTATRQKNSQCTGTGRHFSEIESEQVMGDLALEVLLSQVVRRTHTRARTHGSESREAKRTQTEERESQHRIQ